MFEHRPRELQGEPPVGINTREKKGGFSKSFTRNLVPFSHPARALFNNAIVTWVEFMSDELLKLVAPLHRTTYFLGFFVCSFVFLDTWFPHPSCCRTYGPVIEGWEAETVYFHIILFWGLGWLAEAAAFYWICSFLGRFICFHVHGVFQLNRHWTRAEWMLCNPKGFWGWQKTAKNRRRTGTAGNEGPVFQAFLFYWAR